MKKRLSHALAIAAMGCVTPETEPPQARSHNDVGTATLAILGGRPSGANENNSVRLIAGHPKNHACTATLIAPNVVLTARHCVLQATNNDVPSCTAEGEPTNSVGQDLSNLDATDITISYGESTASQVTANGKTLFFPDALTVCKSDIALLVLASPLADRYAALRFTIPRVGDIFRASGWGYTQASTTKLPTERSTLDNLKVTEVGPGLIPANTFAVAGGTLCFGDSGAGAMDGDTVFGVYSRIEGQACDLSVARNVFMSLAPHRTLFERAFQAAGSTMWLAGDPAPWAPPASTPTCSGGSGGSGGAARCDDAPVAVCAGSGGACDAVNAPPADSASKSSGCTLAPASSTEARVWGWVVLVSATVGFNRRAWRRSRRRSCR